MYNLRFLKDNGDEFYFDLEHQTIFDLEPLSEMDVEIATSQGVAQIGNTVENRAVHGISRTITGRIIGYANEIKRQMLDVFSPFAAGRLYFNNKFYCECVVERTPAIGTRKKDVPFTIGLYCAYPYWLDENTITEHIMIYTPCFSFPGPTSGANKEYRGYDTHIFAIKNEATFFTIHNESEVDTRFSVSFTSDGDVTNYGILNIRTMEYLQINDTLKPYEKVAVYWENGILKVEKTAGGVTTDIFSLLEEDSNLFWLYQGDNVIKPYADDDLFPAVAIEYNNTYVGVYDGM